MHNKPVKWDAQSYVSFLQWLRHFKAKTTLPLWRPLPERYISDQSTRVLFENFKSDLR
jgi:hypothetical protein